MKETQFTGLMEALAFIAVHGGQVEDVPDIPGHDTPHGAYETAGSYTRLADGSYFGVEAYSRGPISEVTGDEDYGVILLGWTEA